MAESKAQGKGKKSELASTARFQPVHKDPDFHHFTVEYKVELTTGRIYATYACQDCELRIVRVHPPVEDFTHHNNRRG